MLIDIDELYVTLSGNANWAHGASVVYSDELRACRCCD